MFGCVDLLIGSSQICSFCSFSFWWDAGVYQNKIISNNFDENRLFNLYKLLPHILCQEMSFSPGKYSTRHGKTNIQSIKICYLTKTSIYEFSMFKANTQWNQNFNKSTYKVMPNHNHCSRNNIFRLNYLFLFIYVVFHLKNI
jgi:hypothetical protein